MNDDERDNLLIRLDERSKAGYEWMSKHDQLHKEEKSTRLKYIIPIYSALVGIVVKMIWWR